jgi:mRNA interferase HigB
MRASDSEAGRVHVISYKAIREFVALHADAGEPLKAWYKAASRARWSNLSEVRREFPHADSVGRFTVFNVKGNRYRLVAEINYRGQVLFVRHILTHEEYDRGRWKQ